MTSIVVNQLLHGYAEGHRAIAGSTVLRSQNDEKRVLIMSDMSGPAWSSSDDSYITGYPLQESGLYALARTWRADEMRRPGCVWTHTLLIGFSDLAALVDPKALNHLFVRPEPASDRINRARAESYGEPLRIEPDVRANLSSALNPQLLAQVLRALYLNPKEPAIIPRSEITAADDMALAIWSEQWPRLRRGFRFCSLVSSDRSRDGERFDLQFVEHSHWSVRSNIQSAMDGHLSSNLTDRWLLTALGGLIERESDELNRFLRWTGSVAPGGRAAFAPLCEIFACLFDTQSQDVDQAIRLANTFEKELETATIWQAIGEIALLVGGPRDRALWPFFLTWYHAGQLHRLTEEQVRRLAERSWGYVGSPDCIAITDVDAVKLADLLGRSPLTYLSEIPLSVLATAVANLPAIFTLPNFSLLAPGRREAVLLQVLDAAPEAAAGMLQIALSIPGKLLAAKLYELVDASYILEGLNQNFSSETGLVWLETGCRHPNKLAEFLCTVRAPSVELCSAIALSCSPKLVPNEVGEDPWLNVLIRLQETPLPIAFATYIAARALGGYSRSAMQLLERVFDRLHDAITESKLSPEEWARLDAVLPPLDEYQGWDRGLRLRMGVASYVVATDVGAYELLAISRRQRTVGWLIDAIRRTTGGKRYLKGVSKELPRYAKGASLLDRLWRTLDD